VNKNAGKPLTVLLVEDNPADVRLTREILKDSPVAIEILIAGDGVQALAMLRREGAYADAIRPDLVLLDLNLPRKSGRELLTDLKLDPHLRHLPVLVMTASTADRAFLAALDPAPDGYLTKPVGPDALLAAWAAVTI